MLPLPPLMYNNSKYLNADTHSAKTVRNKAVKLTMRGRLYLPIITQRKVCLSMFALDLHTFLFFLFFSDRSMEQKQTMSMRKSRWSG